MIRAFPAPARLTRWAVDLGGALVVAWLMVSQVARAEPSSPRVVVEADRCIGLRSDEVGRLLDIELATVTRVDLGGDYEAALRLVGGPPPTPRVDR